MPITSLSPGIRISEIDLTTIAPATPTSVGGIAGVFRWGPVDELILVDSEDNLVSRFGKPTNYNAETFFAAADFLAYTNSLYVVRVISDETYNAGVSNTTIVNETQAGLESGVNFVARYPGALGNSLKISICPSNTAFSSTDVANLQLTVGSNTGTFDSANTLVAGDKLRVGNTAIGYQYLTVTEVDGANNEVSFEEKFRLASASALDVTRYWGEFNTVDGAPSANSFHLVVIDEDGDISGSQGTVLEIYENVSVDSNAMNPDGSSNYYKTVINRRSNWLWATGGTQSASGNAAYTSLTGGADGDDEANIATSKVVLGYDMFVSPEDVDVALIIAGKSRSATIGSYIIDNICEVRKDCMVFISPEKADVVDNKGSEANDILLFRDMLPNTSYAFLDSGYKYRYDKYNDIYRYTPLNGDIAGLTARTDYLRDPWFSPAGYNRGNIKNVTKLAYNPRKADRDRLYVKGVNPVITQPGNGTILFGDKTLYTLNSAFDRINVRRLFITLEKSIVAAAKGTLFELNNEFTRANFRNIVEPFLRDVQGRGGIFDFRVVCDNTNNTAEVIDRNEFIADIYVKPSRSINFIQLNFIPVRTGVEFSEIVGRAS